jgi:hypothetical protein
MCWWYTVAAICKSLGLYRLIYDREENEPYLHRYYLFSTRWLAPLFPKLSYRLVLHNCVKSDEDGLHDHPWDWASKILEEGYWETVPGSPGEELRIRRAPGKWRVCKAEDFHRLELPNGTTSSWSLFLMGPKKKEWGFRGTNGNWVQWEEYLNHRDYDQR